MTVMNALKGIKQARIVKSRSWRRSGTSFKSLLFWLAGEVSWLAVEVLSPCRNKSKDF